MKPICVPCRRFFRPTKNGRGFIEGMPTHNGAAAGLAEPESWKPYKAWMGDEWGCPDCGAVIIVGVAWEPLAEHYQPGFADTVAANDCAEIQINDC
jgi:hypothetical protein